MKHCKVLFASTAMATLAALSPALADVTAQQVWDNWKSYSESYGQTMTGTESMSGGTLMVSDIALTIETPDVKGEGTLGQITFREQGDGTVEVTLSPDYTMTTKSTPAAGDPVVMTMTVQETGLRMIVSGTAAEMTNTLSLPTFTMNMKMAAMGDAFAGATPDIAITMSDIAGTYVTTIGAMRQIDSALTAARATLSVAGTDAKSSTAFRMNMEAADLKLASKATLPGQTDLSNMSAALKAGFVTTGSLSHGAMTYAMTAAENGQNTDVKGAAADGTLTFAMGGSSIGYSGTQNGIAIAISGPQIPVPEATANIAQSAFALTAPVTATEEPRDFALLTALRGVTVSDQIWGMFDPMGTLPRDPANLVVDLTGSARMLVDILDPAAAATLNGPPVELETLTLRDIELTVGGASLTGTGAFTFDNGDTVTFNGMPKPVGSANLKLTGGNTLMDKLVQMGLLPQEQAMGARMMLGLFARPGDGDDTLVSEITVTEDGQILANGQRLR